MIGLILGAPAAHAPPHDRHAESAAEPAGAVPLHLLALWLALAAWLGEIASILLRKYAFDVLHYFYAEAILLGPLANLVIFALATAALLLLRRVLPRLFTTNVNVTLLTILAAFGVTSVYIKWLGYTPTLILSLGIGVQCARMMRQHAPRFAGFVRKSLPPMAALTVLISLGVFGGRVLKERRFAAALGDARAGAPNVILIILDTVRAASMSLYGYARPTTPMLERWAANGARFDYAMSTSSWTVPGHGGFFTGQFPTELRSAYDTPVPRDSHATLAEVLHGQGYQTAGFVANYFNVSREMGLDRGFARYEVHKLSLGQFILSSSIGRAVTNNGKFRRLIGYERVLNAKTADHVNHDFLKWLDARAEGPPFFAFLNYYDAHEPYLPPEPFRTRFALPGPKPLYAYVTSQAKRVEDRDLPKEKIAPQIGGYDGAIAYLDDALHRLFRELEQRGLTQNTLVIVTSDHGEEFGEHRVMAHGRNVYLQSIHVPLVISFPGRVPAGVQVTRPVSLRNIPATVLDLIDLEDASDFSGQSLASHWREPDITPTAGPVFSAVLAQGRPQGLIDGRYHYIKNYDKEELFDFISDPREQVNLASRADSKLLLERFRAAFAAVPGMAR